MQANQQIPVKKAPNEPFFAKLVHLNHVTSTTEAGEFISVSAARRRYTRQCSIAGLVALMTLFLQSCSHVNVTDQPACTTHVSQYCFYLLFCLHVLLINYTLCMLLQCNNDSTHFHTYSAVYRYSGSVFLPLYNLDCNRQLNLTYIYITNGPISNLP